jgi:hypothetical protein
MRAKSAAGSIAATLSLGLLIIRLLWAKYQLVTMAHSIVAIRPENFHKEWKDAGIPPPFSKPKKAFQGLNAAHVKKMYGGVSGS